MGRAGSDLNRSADGQVSPAGPGSGAAGRFGVGGNRFEGGDEVEGSHSGSVVVGGVTSSCHFRQINKPLLNEVYNNFNKKIRLIKKILLDCNRSLKAEQVGIALFDIHC